MIVIIFMIFQLIHAIFLILLYLNVLIQRNGDVLKNNLIKLFQEYVKILVVTLKLLKCMVVTFLKNKLIKNINNGVKQKLV